MAEKIDRDNYCKDCKRSIYGEYKDCDVNIENSGKYVAPPNQACGCKIAVLKSELKDKMLKYGFTAPDMTVTEFVEDFETL